MDFNNLLSLAKENKDNPVSVKCFSTKIAPAKKPPRSNVPSVAVKKFLEKREQEERKKEFEAQRQKEHLLALRSANSKNNKKAKLMASRTKDNNFSRIRLTEHEIESKQKVEASIRRQQLTDKVERMKARIKLEEIEQLAPHKRKRKPKPDNPDGSPPSVGTPTLSKKAQRNAEYYAEKPEKKIRKMKAPSAPMSFSEIMRLAALKQNEVPGGAEDDWEDFDEDEDDDDEEEEGQRLMSKKEKVKAKEEQAHFKKKDAEIPPSAPPPQPPRRGEQHHPKSSHPVGSSNAPPRLKNTPPQQRPPPGTQPNSSRASQPNGTTKPNLNVRRDDKNIPSYSTVPKMQQNGAKNGFIKPKQPGVGGDSNNMKRRMDERDDYNSVPSYTTVKRKAPQDDVNRNDAATRGRPPMTTSKGSQRPPSASNSASIGRKENSIPDRTKNTKTNAGSSLQGGQNSRPTKPPPHLNRNAPPSNRNAPSSSASKNVPPQSSSRPNPSQQQSAVKGKLSSTNVPSSSRPTKNQPGQMGQGRPGQMRPPPPGAAKTSAPPPRPIANRNNSTGAPPPGRQPVPRPMDRQPGPPQRMPPPGRSRPPPHPMRHEPWPNLARNPYKKLPPITSSRPAVRRIESDDEDDEEMNEFIDDDPMGDLEDYSKHIREIFGYDKRKYTYADDEYDDIEETSFAEQMKEENRSARIALQEDLDEYHKELEAERRLKLKKKSK